MPVSDTKDGPSKHEVTPNTSSNAVEISATFKTEGSIPGRMSWSADSQRKRLAFLQGKTGMELPALSGKSSDIEADKLRGNIEHYIGMTRIPTGIVGPVLVKGGEAKGEFYVPMATTEGALVASYNRGAMATKQSGGVVSICVSEAIQRTPAFKFFSLNEAVRFVQWTSDLFPQFAEIVRQTSRYALLNNLKINMEGNVVILIFEYTTGEAGGQNMVTICTHAVCQFIVSNTPVLPQHWFIEGNFSGDKKATVTALSHVREIGRAHV